MSERSQLKHLLVVTFHITGWIFVVLAWLVLLAWSIGFIFTDRWSWSQWLWWIPSVAALGASMLGFIAAWRPVSVHRKKRRRIIVWSVILVILAGYVFTIEHRFFRASLPPQEFAGAFQIVHVNVASPYRNEREAAVNHMLDLNAHLTILTDAHLVQWQPIVRQRLGDTAYLITRIPFAVISTLPIIELRPLVAAGEIYATQLRVNSEPVIGRDLTILLIDLPSTLSLSRMEVALRLRRLLDEADVIYQPDIIIGDFNITRGSASLSSIVRDMPHAWDVAGRGWGATYPREWPVAHIDHVFFNPDTVQVLDYELHDLGAVRHRAQKAIIRSR